MSFEWQGDPQPALLERARDAWPHSATFKDSRGGWWRHGESVCTAYLQAVGVITTEALLVDSSSSQLGYRSEDARPGELLVAASCTRVRKKVLGGELRHEFEFVVACYDEGALPLGFYTHVLAPKTKQHERFLLTKETKERIVALEGKKVSTPRV